jgi:hypothetical protein
MTKADPAYLLPLTGWKLEMSTPYSAIYSTSGSPVAMEVSTDKRPARADAETTTAQSTSVISAVVPIVATAVWQIVRTARMAVALQNSLVIFSSLL